VLFKVALINGQFEILIEQIQLVELFGIAAAEHIDNR